MNNLKVGDILYFKGDTISVIDVKIESRSIQNDDRFIITQEFLAYSFITIKSTKKSTTNQYYEFYVDVKPDYKGLLLSLKSFINEKESRKLKLQKIYDI